ncbi:hypothetical protein CDAR_522861 [Caerostris darwini]|uniref:ABC transmembrane type-1 domain-containing protein n=1 Tax=Caerostris darwini TaxID=1538125 RepID=A0AAV4VD74_9ARAC|nr:hypothetical protein CDAR_522861 [Caerostris darwini]
MIYQDISTAMMSVDNSLSFAVLLFLWSNMISLFLFTYDFMMLSHNFLSSVVRATFRHLERINSVIDAFYRQVKLPTDRIISKLLGGHGDSDSLRYVPISNNRQRQDWTVESMPGESFHKGAA